MLVFFGCSSLYAQTTAQKTKLQNQYNQLIGEIKNIENLLNKTKEEKEQSLSQLQSLSQKIAARQSLISNIKSQVQYLQNNIDENNKIIKAMQKDLEDLKKSYAEMVRNSYKKLHSKNQLNFIFSADNFNQALQRYSYLKTYSKYKQNQAELIKKTIADIELKIKILEEEKKEKQALLDEELKQNNLLLSEKNEKDNLLKKLQNDESDLLKKAKEKNAAAQSLNNQIQKIIEEEIRLAKEKAEKAAKDAAAKGKVVPKTEGGLALSPEEKLISSDFVLNRGKLPWPVAKGHIVERFGEHPHPTLKGVVVNNNGIDIRTETEADVRSIFEGSVVSTFYMPTTQNSIIIKHGEYYSVYSNLKSVSVKANDKVSTKQVIGKAYSGSGATKVHLEVWKGTVKTNPELWLSR